MENQTQEFYAVEKNLLQAVISYLSKRPFEEVSHAVTLLQQSQKIDLIQKKTPEKSQSGQENKDSDLAHAPV